MAIYSLHHSSIGKMTQDNAHTSAAHIRYITRDKACRAIECEHMPEEPGKAQSWMKSEEDADRKNARICDKVMIALPKELNQEERVQVVRDFASRVTAGRVPWFAAVHDKGKDENNPHCHLVFRDRDRQTGKRVLHMSAGKSERRLLKEKGIDAMTTERMRVIWEHAANEALERAGHLERIDHRSLKAQGIEREPTIHEGVRARQMTERGEKPKSKVVEFPNSPTAKANKRSVDYKKIDGGKSRQEHNAEIINLREYRKERGDAMATWWRDQERRKAKMMMGHAERHSDISPEERAERIEQLYREKLEKSKSEKKARERSQSRDRERRRER